MPQITIHAHFVLKKEDKEIFQTEFCAKIVSTFASHTQIPKISQPAEISLRTHFTRNSSWGALCLLKVNYITN